LAQRSYAQCSSDVTDDVKAGHKGVELSKTEAEIYGCLPTFKGHAAQFGSTAPNRRLRGDQRSVSPGIGSAQLPSTGLIQSVIGSHFPCRRVNPICFASLIPHCVKMRAQAP
jgi:hypothetical protein